MTSNPNNPSFKIREKIDGIRAFHVEGLKRVADLEQELNVFLRNSDSENNKSDDKKDFVAFANGTGVTAEAFSKIKEDDFDVVLDLKTNRLRFRQDPSKNSDLIDSELENIGRRRIAFFAYMIEHPAVDISIANVSQFYDSRYKLRFNTVSKTIQKLRRALGNSKQTYIATEKPWENDHCSYKLSPQWRYLLIK